jgi:hypothetical protein
MKIEEGGASILLFNLSLLIPGLLSGCSIECVRLHGAFRSGNPPSFSVHQRGSKGFPTRLYSNTRRHGTQLWRFGYCEGLIILYGNSRL